MKKKNPLRDIIVRSCSDKAFRQEFLQDPSGVLQRMGFHLPEGKKIKVLESTDEMTYVVIPSSMEDQPANWEQQERPAPGEKRQAAGLAMEWDDNGLTLNGRIDSTSAKGLKEEMDRATGNLLVDMSAVTFMSSAGISVFVATQKRLTQRGKELSLYNATPAVQNLFALTGLDSMFYFISDSDMYVPYGGFGMF